MLKVSKLYQTTDRVGFHQKLSSLMQLVLFIFATSKCNLTLGEKVEIHPFSHTTTCFADCSKGDAEIIIGFPRWIPITSSWWIPLTGFVFSGSLHRFYHVFLPLNIRIFQEKSMKIFIFLGEIYAGWWLSPTPLKNMSSSVGIILPNILEKHMFQSPPSSMGWNHPQKPQLGRSQGALKVRAAMDLMMLTNMEETSRFPWENRENIWVVKTPNTLVVVDVHPTYINIGFKWF